MFPIDLSGKKGIIFGVANDRSIAWGITQALSQAGARIAMTYQGDRLKGRVEGLADTLQDALTLPCDATDDDQIAQVFQSLKEEFGEISFLVHSIAFANREDLDGRYADTGREGYRIALEVSAYSLLPLVRHAAPLMTQGGSVVAMTFDASRRVYPGYNVMGTAKAALEHGVRQLAYEFGEQNISGSYCERPDAPESEPVMTASGLGCVETADDFRLDLRDADIWANERLCPDLGSDRLRVGGNWGLGCAGEFKLRV